MLVSQSRRTSEMGQLEACGSCEFSSVYSCLPVSWFLGNATPPQVAVRSSCLHFFSSFLQDLFCLCLPAVSLVWNIFVPLYPIGFKLPVSFPDFWPGAQRIPGCSLLCFAFLPRVAISFLLDLFNIQLFILSLGLSRNTGLCHYFVCHCCDVLEQRRYTWAWILSHPWPFFSAQPSLYVQWLLSKGKFYVCWSSGVSGCVLTIICHIISCQVFDETDGKKFTTGWLVLNDLADYKPVFLHVQTTKREVGLQTWDLFQI